VARTCTICSHPKLVNIDRQLLRGDMLNSIAHRFHVSPDAVGVVAMNFAYTFYFDVSTTPCNFRGIGAECCFDLR
jgi:hypothetical protein